MGYPDWMLRHTSVTFCQRQRQVEVYDWAGDPKTERLNIRVYSVYLLETLETMNYKTKTGTIYFTTRSEDLPFGFTK